MWKENNYEKVNCNISFLILENKEKNKEKNVWNILYNNLARTHYKLLRK